MNSGAFGENFPYSNFHDLNMDWIIKIAKDFLDQYTHIQSTITEGETQLTEKKEELEQLLQEWYDNHSELIARELAQALRDIRELLTNSETDFNEFAQEVAETLIPPDNLLLSHTWDQAKDSPSRYALQNGYWTTSLVWHDYSADHQYKVSERFPIEVGDVVSFNAPSAWSYNFFDAEGNIALVINTDAYDPVDIIIGNSTYKYLSITLNVSEYFQSYLEVRIDNLAHKLSEYYKTTVPFLSTGYWTVTGNFRTDTSRFHTTHRLPIKAGCTIEVPALTAGYIYIFASSASLLEAVPISPSTTPQYTVTQPTAKYFSIMCDRAYYNEDTIDIIINSNTIKSNIYAELTENVLQVRTRYRTTVDLITEFKVKGHNNLPDFSGIFTAPNVRKYPMPNMDNLTSLLSIGTDWHAPFVIEALTNIDGDRTTQVNYTGGNHSYDPNDPDSTPTARNTDLRYYIDGVLVSSYKGYCSTITIEWTNRVQAYNTVKSDGTGREVLEERHTMTFDGIKWTSKVDIIPLENINMRKYYGWALSGLQSIYPNYVFEGGEPRNVMQSPDTYSTSDHKTYIINAYGTGNRITLALNTAFDMGDRRFCENSTQIIHSQPNKAYEMLIENTLLTSSYHYRAEAQYVFSGH